MTTLDPHAADSILGMRLTLVSGCRPVQPMVGRPSAELDVNYTLSRVLDKLEACATMSRAKYKYKVIVTSDKVAGK